MDLNIFRNDLSEDEFKNLTQLYDQNDSAPNAIKNPLVLAVENYPFVDHNVAGLGFQNDDGETIDLGQVQKSEFFIKGTQALGRQQQQNPDQPLTNSEIDRTLKNVELSTQASNGPGITDNALNKILKSGNVIVNTVDDRQRSPDVSIGNTLDNIDGSESLGISVASNGDSFSPRDVVQNRTEKLINVNSAIINDDIDSQNYEYNASFGADEQSFENDRIAKREIIFNPVEGDFPDKTDLKVSITPELDSSRKSKEVLDENNNFIGTENETVKFNRFLVEDLSKDPDLRVRKDGSIEILRKAALDPFDDYKNRKKINKIVDTPSDISFSYVIGYAPGADGKIISTAVGARNAYNYLQAYKKSLGRDLTPREQSQVMELMALPVEIIRGVVSTRLAAAEVPKDNIKGVTMRVKIDRIPERIKIYHREFLKKLGLKGSDREVEIAVAANAIGGYDRMVQALVDDAKVEDKVVPVSVAESLKSFDDRFK